MAPGTEIRASVLLPPSARVRVSASGPAAASLEVGLLRDGEPPLSVELAGAGGAVAGDRWMKVEVPTAAEIVVSLPRASGEAACLEGLSIEAPRRKKAVTKRSYDAVVIVMTDTMRGDLYPQEESSFGVDMPNMEELASRSSVFVQATAHASYTKPSVGTILTGLYPEDHGGLPRKAPVSGDATLVSEILEAAGVRTVAFLSNFFFNPGFGMRRGWSEEHFVDPWQASIDDQIVLDELERWCDAGVPEGPLFVYVHLMGAHAPYAPPDHVRKAFLAGQSLAARLDPRSTAQLIKDLTSGKERRLTSRERGQLEALYRADAAYHDEIMGRLLAALGGSGLLDRALLIYTSDHGEEFYEHGRVGHGTGLWHEQVHVPLLIHAPGQASGRTVSMLAGHVDIVPTVLEALGVETPDGLPGRSLFGSVVSETDFRPLLMQHWTGRWGVQLGPWKLQRRPADERLSYSHVAEETDASIEGSPVLHMLLRKELAWSYVALGARSREAGDEVDLDPELADQLEKLGYVMK
jgi:hypothetical protein